MHLVPLGLLALSVSKRYWQWDSNPHLRLLRKNVDVLHV